ncbi:MAG TPA: hypothetical protein VFW44_10180, partial [Bryobacteraceae bacterium]|nr:hypothetical protein [Bryobacteraceae bacterium]
GMALDAFGRPEEALRYVSDAATNRRRNRPGTHYLSQMLEDQALILAELGRYREASGLLDEAAAIKAKINARKDINHMAARLKIDFLQGDPGDAKETIDSFYGAVPASAPLSPRLLRNLQARADLALLQNDPKTAISMAQRLSDVVRSNHDEFYLKSWLAQAQMAEGQARLMEHDPSAALPALRTATQSEEEMLDASSPVLGRAEALLGTAYFDLGDRAQAEAALAKAAGILRVHPQLSEYYGRPARDLAKRLKAAPRAESNLTTN